RILGRAFKNEHIALGVLTLTFGGAFLATRGGKSESKAAPQSIQQAKASVSLSAGSREEELFASIKKFVEEAEKESKH
ncbi:hypothetical protein AN958_12454, partial [Leucoagaricus sp. SymC.cos]